MMRVQFNKLKAARSIIFQRVQPDIQDMHILQLFRTIFQTFFSADQSSSSQQKAGKQREL